MNNPGNQNSEPKEQIDQLKFYQLDPTFIEAIKQLKLRQSLCSQNLNPENIRIGLSQMDFQDLLGTKYYDEEFINQFFNGKTEPWNLSSSDFNDSNQKLMIWQQNISLIRKSEIPKIKLFVDDLNPEVQQNKSLLYSILHIQFNNLKALHITQERSIIFIDLQFLNWIKMPKLQALHIQTDNVVSLRPLCKTNLKELRELKITMSDDEEFTNICKDIPTFMSRIRTSKCAKNTLEREDLPTKTLYFFSVQNQRNLPSVNMFKADLRMPDMSSICKFESQTVHLNLLDSLIYNNRVHEVIKRKNCNNIIQYSQRIFDQMNIVRMRNDEDADIFFDQDQLQNRWNMFRNSRRNRRNTAFNYRQYQQDLQQDHFPPLIGNYHLEV